MKTIKKTAIIILILTIFLTGIPAVQAASPPVASFTSASPQTGTFILPMVFKDTSTNTPTAWVWTCKNLTPGNNTEVVFSTVQNPTFSFGVGNWAIKLKASNAAGTSSTPGTFYVKVRTLQNIQLFPKDYIWNVRVDTLPVDPRSNTYINKMMENSQARNYVEPQWGRSQRAEPNIFESPSEVTYYNLGTSVIVRTPITHDPLYTENTNRGEYSCTADGDDCHAYIIDKTNMLAYELYQVNRNPGNNTYTAKSVVVWNLSDYKLLNPGTPTVDEGGMSMLSGFIYYDEVASDSVSHATRFATEFTNGETGSNVWPAIKAGSRFFNPSYPGLGQRFRLKASFDESGYSTQAKAIIHGWKKYGLIVASNSAPGQRWVPSGFGDPRFNSGLVSELNRIKTTDFEAVDTSGLMISPNSGQARITPVVTPTSSITVKTPNGGEAWVRGSTHAINWTSSGSVGSYVKIELLKAGAVVQTLLSSTPNDGSYSSWIISNGLATGTDYRVRVTSTTNPAITDTSNGNFAITSGTTTPSITVITPNGGEIWARNMGLGPSQSIKWSYTGNPGSTVKIELLKGGVFYKVLNSSTSIGSAGSGSYPWKISKDTLLGTVYKIRVTSTSNVVYSDMSNANFIVN